MKTMLEQSKEIRSAGARLAGVATKEYKGFKIIIHSRTVKEGANIPTASYFAEVPELDWSSKYFKTTAEAAKDAMKLIDESARDVGLSAGSRLWSPIKLPSNTSFTVYQVKPDGSLSGKEHLNSPEEVAEWYGRKNYGQVCIVNDKTGEKKYYQDSGQGMKEVRMSSDDSLQLQPLPNEMPGGLGDKLTPADVDPIEFDMGMKMEKEHTPDEATRQEIVLDHLAEDPAYYSKLKQMEGQGVDVQMFGEMRATKL